MPGILIRHHDEAGSVQWFAPAVRGARLRGWYYLFRRGLLVFAALGLCACGRGVVEVGPENYAPKIVVEGFIFPFQPVKGIRITRNYPLNTDIEIASIVLSDADVQLEDEGGTAYRLTYDPFTFAFAYAGDDLVITPGNTYTLRVAAEIDGVPLHAESTTTVPAPGLQIDYGASQLTAMVYRERDENDRLKRFRLAFSRSPGSDFYALALTALDADTSTFIYQNPFHEFDAEDVLEDFDLFRNRFTWIQDTPLIDGKSEMEIFWFDIWFYGRYEAVLYAGDRNFKDFLTTHDQVMEIDGNFHEPAFHFQGDGIGVFASAVADTVRFEVLQQHP